MSLIDILKSDVGPISGLIKSKKYLLTVAFASFCTSAFAVATDQITKVALVAAAALTIAAYMIGQSIVESSGARLVEEEEIAEEDPQPASPTVTLGPK